MRHWLRHQKHALAAALRRLFSQPLVTLFTALAMGVAISLPSALYLMLGNLNRLAGDLPAQPEISLFLSADVTPAQKSLIASRLRQGDIAEARHIPKEKALAALGASEGLADITAGLNENPLPDAWIVRPRQVTPDTLTRLAGELGKLPGVAETQLDSEWTERLQAALAIGRTGVWLLGSLFAIALMAISSNAIRARVLTRRDEIHVSRLIGATHRYIRRPFLYLGALQGLLGGLAAGGVLALAGALLRAPVAHLSALYGASFQLLPPSGGEMAIVLAITTATGWLGAWIAVTRTLHQTATPR
ncbi:MAG: cell division protein FtsX [Hydrogenophilales bacterium 12-61-10]|nr:MAG: cell division protein FtsX [Hydrogenophilales bacterium 12-61-10]OYX31704.1 MAG: cell division protein FtsX [Hydrogenophilales bacterium 32-62-9]